MVFTFFFCLCFIQRRIPKSFPSRPTTDFAKEGLFNILEHQYSLEHLKILDLCAGSGNISFEFLSREAGTVVAVDKNYNCYKHIKAMSYKYECENDIAVIKADLVKYLNQTNEKFDLIFAILSENLSCTCKGFKCIGGWLTSAYPLSCVYVCVA